MALNEKNYPMAYEEYEKRVMELFLESYDDEVMEEIIKRVNDLLKEKPNFLEAQYGYDCFTYDSPNIYGETCKETFEDNFLRQTPVANLRMLIG